MTTADGGSEVAYGRPAHEFELLREELWRAFYRMSFRDRLLTLVDEGRLFIVFAVGIVSYSFVTPYRDRIVELFDMSAYAQAAPQFIGMSKADWVLGLSVVTHGFLMAACALCFLHMLKAKKANTWVAKTGTFLFGFLVKAATGFIPG